MVTTPRPSAIFAPEAPPSLTTKVSSDSASRSPITATRIELAGLAACEGQPAGGGLVVAARDRRPVGRAVIDGHRMGAGYVQAHPHHGVVGAGVAFDEQRGVAHHERGRHDAGIDCSTSSRRRVGRGRCRAGPADLRCQVPGESNRSRVHMRISLGVGGLRDYYGGPPGCADPAPGRARFATRAPPAESFPESGGSGDKQAMADSWLPSPETYSFFPATPNNSSASARKRRSSSSGPVVVHPCDGLAVAFAGFVLVAQLPVTHGQEEPVVAVAPLAEFHHRLLQRTDGHLPVARPIVGHAQRVPMRSIRGPQIYGLLGEYDRAAASRIF